MNDLESRAQAVLVGGVNSPVRSAYQRVLGMEPAFVSGGQGAYLRFADGRKLIDYCLAYGPLILGHGHPEVVEVIRRTAASGTSFGVTSELEVLLAERIAQCMPAIEKVRFVNSGTEATMVALRLARAVSGRDRIVKFDGCYHGHVDALLVQAGSGVATLGLAGSPGIPSTVVSDTVVIPFNDLDAATRVFAESGSQIAAVIVEPVAGNMGCIAPQDGFLQLLRTLCDQAGALLIFDEVMTGFRVGSHGAQGRFNVRPDLTTLGKVIGGGLPIGACGGPAGIMDQLAPAGAVYQAGTFSGNPLAMAAGLKTLEVLDRQDGYAFCEHLAQRLACGLREVAEQLGVTVQVNQIGGMLSMFFSQGPVTDYTAAKRADQDKFAKYYRKLWENGVHLAPSQFETSFVSLAHTSEVIDTTLEAHHRALQSLLP